MTDKLTLFFEHRRIVLGTQYSTRISLKLKLTLWPFCTAHVAPVQMRSMATYKTSGKLEAELVAATAQSGTKWFGMWNNNE
jgi:hypothetical protein